MVTPHYTGWRPLLHGARDRHCTGRARLRNSGPKQPDVNAARAVLPEGDQHPGRTELAQTAVRPDANEADACALAAAPWRPASAPGPPSAV